MKKGFLTKIFMLLGILMLTLGIYGFKTEAIDTTKVSSFNGSNYKVDSVVEEHNLIGGVKHTKYIAESSYSANTIDSYIGSTFANQYYKQSVNILEVPANTGVKIVHWAYEPSTTTGWILSTVVKMAENYEKNNPGYKVIGAINGDFFDIRGEASYGPLLYSTRGVVVSEGQSIRSVDARGTNNSPLTIGFKNDGTSSTYVQGGKLDFTDNHMLYLYNEKGEVIQKYEVTKINSVPSGKEISVYYSYPTGYITAKTQEKATVQIPSDSYICDSPERIVPNSQTDVYALGSLVKTVNAVDVAWGQFGVSVKDTEIRKQIETAAYVKIQKDVIGDYEDCGNVGGGVFPLLYKGTGSANQDVYRHPRTMIGARADGTVIMATVDGRQKSLNMHGMTGDELACTMQYYGCVSAVNLDGGGSTTMIIRDENGEFEVLNSPSDGNLRNDANCYLVVMKEADFSIESKTILDDSITFKLNTDEVDFTKTTAIKCTLNGVTKTVTNNTVTFDGLTHNTEYKYAFTYDTATQSNLETMLTDNIYTAKTMPVFEELNIEVWGDKIIFSPTIIDEDEALEYYRIFINNKRYPYLDEPIEVKYNLEGVTEIEYDILVAYDLNDGNGKIEKTYSKTYNLNAPDPGDTEKTCNEDPTQEKCQTTDPVEETKPKKGCKKNVASFIISIISLGSLVIFIKKKD